MARRGIAAVPQIDHKQITTTLAHLVSAEVALAKLGARPLPPKAAYHVAKLARLAGQEIEIFREKRNALIKELGNERDATDAEKAQGYVGQVMQVKPEHEKAFHARVRELGEIEVTLPWAPIDLVMLGDQPITAGDLLALGPLLTEGL